MTLVDSGSHDDMDAHTFMRSLFALRSYFVQIAEPGAEGAAFEALERCGIEAEARMLAATGGINTHRGAIFMLGLLCAAAGAVRERRLRAEPVAAARTLLPSTGATRWRREPARQPTLPGGIAARRHGLRSASSERRRSACRCCSRRRCPRCRRR